MSNLLDALIGRIDFVKNGVKQARRSKMVLGGGLSIADDPVNDQQTLTAASGSAGDPVGDLAAMRNLSAVSGAVVDGQVRQVLGDPVPWVFSATTGANFADDGKTCVKLNETLLASNGRFYRATASPVLPTIAALRLAVSGSHQAIHVQAYSTLGDGGGDIFDYDASDTTTADNGGTIIVAGTRRYKRRYSGSYNVRHFGAKGDGEYFTGAYATGASHTITIPGRTYSAADIGKLIYLDAADGASGTFVSTVTGGSGNNFTTSAAVGATISSSPGKRAFLGTDDYAAIMAAYAAAVASNGGTLFLPRGICGSSASIVVQHESIRFVGEGRGGGNSVPETFHHISTIQFANTGNGLFFDGGASGMTTALYGCGVSHLALFGTSKSDILIRSRGSHHFVYDRVTTANCTSAGIKTEFAICPIISHHVHSTNETVTLASAVPTYGMWLTSRAAEPSNGTSAGNIDVAIEEGVTNGIFMEVGNNVNFNGGTAEGCKQWGVIVGGGAEMCEFTSMDLEANSSASAGTYGDILVQQGAFANKFIDNLAVTAGANGGITFAAGSYGNTVDGGEYTNVLIKPTDGTFGAALLTTIKNVLYTGTYTDGGTLTRNYGTWKASNGFWDRATIPGGLDVVGGLTAAGGATITGGADITGGEVIRSADVDPSNSTQPWKLVDSADLTRGMYGAWCAANSYGGSLGYVYFQGQKPGVGIVPLVLNPAGGYVSIGSPIATTAYIKTILTATVAPVFSVLHINQTQVQTVTVTGAAVGDDVTATPEFDPGTGLVWSCRVTAADTVEIKLMNGLAGDNTPNNGNWRVKVFKFY